MTNPATITAATTPTIVKMSRYIALLPYGNEEYNGILIYTQRHAIASHQEVLMSNCLFEYFFIFLNPSGARTALSTAL